ncbi:Protein of unknown function [Alkalibacterium subtropicum]|uniref:DUF2975 domain-containing protein n=1 Tax=Alkalibacterium subtropicum TaxID=753702 RepID=A0A1I1I8N4_9LACT|nr:DUF2975 domain-containing protein [Alkalibacterium subtropicum]SFC32627.1 Protein of unknown function [Alkalibacterium subtropicum]
MNVNRFRQVSRLLSLLFKGFGVLSIAALLLIVVFYFFLETDSATVDIAFSDSPLLHFSDSRVTEADFRFGAFLIAPVFLALSSYILFKGSFLFDRLVRGETPFTYGFAESVKWISIILIVADILLPLLYSLIVNLSADEGFFFIIDLSSAFMVGLILYIVSEILKYGISLQELADDTV